MLAQHRRIVLVLAISAAVVLSIGAGAILLLRPSVEMRVTDVGMVPDSPQVGMTEVHVQLILRNVGRRRPTSLGLPFSHMIQQRALSSKRGPIWKFG